MSDDHPCVFNPLAHVGIAGTEPPIQVMHHLPVAKIDGGMVRHAVVAANLHQQHVMLSRRAIDLHKAGFLETFRVQVGMAIVPPIVMPLEIG